MLAPGMPGQWRVLARDQQAAHAKAWHTGSLDVQLCTSCHNSFNNDIHCPRTAPAWRHAPGKRFERSSCREPSSYQHKTAMDAGVVLECIGTPW